MKAIHKDDLKTFLSEIGEIKKVEKGKAKCNFCDKIITMENIHAIFPNKSKVAYVCDSNECIQRFLNRG